MQLHLAHGTALLLIRDAEPGGFQDLWGVGGRPWLEDSVGHYTVFVDLVAFEVPPINSGWGWSRGRVPRCSSQSHVCALAFHSQERSCIVEMEEQAKQQSKNHEQLHVLLTWMIEQKPSCRARLIDRQEAADAEIVDACSDEAAQDRGYYWNPEDAGAVGQAVVLEACHYGEEARAEVAGGVDGVAVQ